MEKDEVYKGRLLLLADFLEKLEPERFYFNSWVGKSWAGHADLSCGTTACGLGWASAMPEFQALGLHLSNAGQEVPIHPRLREDKTGEFWEATCRATEFIFGLNDVDTELLFVATEDETDEASAVDDDVLMSAEDEGKDGRLSRRATPKRLAQHIKSFVEYKYGATP
jgi:hypothetical protein